MSLEGNSAICTPGCCRIAIFVGVEVPYIESRVSCPDMTPEPERTDRASLVRDRLVLSQDAIFAETVTKAERVLRLDEEGGIHPVVEISSLGNKQKIELVLLGKYLGKAGKLHDKDTVSDDEIARFLGLTVREVQKRVHDLRASGRIESVGEGSYRVTEGRLKELLRDLGAE